MQRPIILGVPFDPETIASAVERMLEWVHGYDQHHVATPNNEMVVAAQRNPQFMNLLQRTALNLPDSIGVVWAARCTGQRLPGRVPGVDAVTALCRQLTADVPVFLLGAAEGVAEDAGRALMTLNPQLVIAGTYAGSPADGDAAQIVDMINASGARLLLVAYGAPQQDLWIDAHYDDLKTVRLAMGVGGTFDFLAGRIQRAPQWLRSLGLEWLWRLLQEPKRFPRIVTAVVRFPWLVLRHGRRSLLSQSLDR